MSDDEERFQFGEDSVVAAAKLDEELSNIEGGAGSFTGQSTHGGKLARHNSTFSEDKQVIVECLSVDPHQVPWVLDPRSAPMKRWDFAMAFLLLYTAGVTPYEAAFLTPVWPSTLFVLNRMVDICFVMDFVSQFFLAFYNSESHMWITNHNKIACKYFKAWFVVDLVSIVPFDTVAVILKSQGSNNADT